MRQAGLEPQRDVRRIDSMHARAHTRQVHEDASTLTQKTHACTHAHTHTHTLAEVTAWGLAQALEIAFEVEDIVLQLERHAQMLAVLERHLLGRRPKRLQRGMSGVRHELVVSADFCVARGASESIALLRALRSNTLLEYSFWLEDPHLARARVLSRPTNERFPRPAPLHPQASTRERE
jgi:hypothetical protein